MNEDFFTFSDTDIPMLKSWFSGMFKAGMPLMLHPRIAKSAIEKGFVEGEHFLITRPIPTSAERA